MCVWLFWPLVKLFKSLHISIDPMRSIMNTSATFILLSITKFSINLLAFISLFDVNGILVRHVPLFDGNTEYFGGSHLPYAILAIVVLSTCSLLPLLLLLLSPLKSFQRCLRWCCCSFRGVHFVNAFLEVYSTPPHIIIPTYVAAVDISARISPPTVHSINPTRIHV